MLPDAYAKGGADLVGFWTVCGFVSVPNPDPSTNPSSSPHPNLPYDDPYTVP